MTVFLRVGLFNLQKCIKENHPYANTSFELNCTVYKGNM